MTEVVICSVSRTPVGKFRGSLAPFSAVELGVFSVKNLFSRMNIDPSSGIIDEVIFGQVLQAGAGQAPARQVAIGAGLPVTTPALTINKVCGSSLKAGDARRKFNTVWRVLLYYCWWDGKHDKCSKIAHPRPGRSQKQHGS